MQVRGREMQATGDTEGDCCTGGVIENLGWGSKRSSEDFWLLGSAWDSELGRDWGKKGRGGVQGSQEEAEAIAGGGRRAEGNGTIS